MQAIFVLALLSEKNVLVVPAKELFHWVQMLWLWQDDPLPVGGVVFNAVFKFFVYPTAHFQAVLGRDRDVTTVKKRVHVLAKQNSVCDGVWSTFAERFDMGSVQYV